MMKQDNKVILKNVILFGVVLTILNIVLSLILQQLHTGKNQAELMLSIGMEAWFWDFIRVGVFVWASIRIARNLEELRYWKLAVAVIGIVVLDYHLFYLYDVIDYYVIHKPPVKEQSDALVQMLNLMEGNSKPHYSPIYDLIGSWFYSIQIYFSVGAYRELLFQLILGTIVLPLWISIIVFFSFRKR